MWLKINSAHTKSVQSSANPVDSPPVSQLLPAANVPVATIQNFVVVSVHSHPMAIALSESDNDIQSKSVLVSVFLGID
jgi:proteasome lid subunit RPN8/RPN11